MVSFLTSSVHIPPFFGSFHFKVPVFSLHVAWIQKETVELFFILQRWLSKVVGFATGKLKWGMMKNT